MFKIKVTRRQYKIIINLYRIIMFIIALALLIIYSILIDKLAEFCIMFISYFITKDMYTTQYHSNSMKMCLLMSLFVFAVSLTLCVDSDISLICSALFGLIISFVSSHVGKIKQDLKDYERLRKEEIERNSFNTATCSEEQLLARCKELGLNNEQIDFCVKAFSDKLAIKDLAEYYCLEIQSVKNKKQIYKNKLNGK